MKKLFVTGIGVLAFAFANAQCPQVTCPGNVTVDNDPGKCSAVVNYTVTAWDSCGSGSQTYNFTGSVQFYVVPAGVTMLNIAAAGAQGGANAQSLAGGLGGDATGDLAVTPGDTLWIYVGGSNGFNGGGNGGSTSGCTTAAGGDGGGASDVRVGGQALTNRVIVAGGGGGAGGNRIQGCGRGSGGGGGGGYYGGGGGAGWPGSGTMPGGGTQTAGGAAGTTTTGAGATNGTAGALGTGGNGGGEQGSNQGGNGTAQTGGTGGGLTGGPGAYVVNWTGASGAGGSGYIGGVTNGVMNSGTQTGNGVVTISYSGPITLTQISGQASGSAFPVGTTTNTYVAAGASGPNDTCSFTVTVNDTNAAPTLGALSQDTLCTTSGTITLPAGSPAGGVYSGAGVTGNMFDPATAEKGDHWIYYTDTSGCNHADSVLITVVWCTGIDEEKTLAGVEIAPNPSNGQFRVNVGEGVSATISVMDVVGRLVVEQTEIRKTHLLDISNEEAGVYLVKVEINGISRSIRLIKE